MNRSRLPARLALGWLIFAAVFSFAVPFFFSHSYTRPVGPALSSPSQHPLLGTDDLGRDLLLRLAYGGRVSLLAALGAAGVALLIGGTAGLTAAIGGGIVDRVILWGANITLAIPGLLIALVLAAAFRPTPLTVVLAVGLSDAPAFTRTARAVFAQLRSMRYVTAAGALGASRARLAIRHILPNSIPQLIPLATTHFAWALTGITTLSFLGLAGDPSLPEWGAILNTGRAFLLRAPWIAISSGSAIGLTILAVHYLGRWLAEKDRHG